MPGNRHPSLKRKVRLPKKISRDKRQSVPGNSRRKRWQNGGVCRKKFNIHLKNKVIWYYQYYWGMNWIWWIVWGLIVIWIFALPIGIPGQRYQRERPLNILKKRFARGQIDQKEYRERKAKLEK